MITKTLKFLGAFCFLAGALLIILGGLAALQSQPAVVALPWGLTLILVGGPLYALARIVELLERIAENTRRPFLSRPGEPREDELSVEKYASKG